MLLLLMLLEMAFVLLLVCRGGLVGASEAGRDLGMRRKLGSLKALEALSL